MGDTRSLDYSSDAPAYTSQYATVRLNPIYDSAIYVQHIIPICNVYTPKP